MRIQDGFPTLLSISFNPVLFGNPLGDLWIKRITPPGFDTGGPIEDTNMHNQSRRTKWPKTLITTTDATLMCSYDPFAYSTVVSSLGVVGTMTYTFPTLDTYTTPGYIDKWTQAEHSEGNQPETTLVVVHTNQTLDIPTGRFAETPGAFAPAP